MKPDSVKLGFYQESDCCSHNDNGHELFIETQDGGGGAYVVIKTDRWALDLEDIDKFAETLKSALGLIEK